MTFVAPQLSVNTSFPRPSQDRPSPLIYEANAAFAETQEYLSRVFLLVQDLVGEEEASVLSSLAVASCQFSDCLHRDEPNCVVRGDWERYEYYLDFLEKASLRQEQLDQQGEPESTLKLKTKGKGQNQYEPKLETKKYRRLSRRTQQQALQELYQEAEE